jgi:hypothetical protein
LVSAPGESPTSRASAFWRILLARRTSRILSPTLSTAKPRAAAGASKLRPECGIIAREREAELAAPF